eukprot:8370511-Pyramimonas_sp.AAC.1
MSRPFWRRATSSAGAWRFSLAKSAKLLYSVRCENDPKGPANPLLENQNKTRSREHPLGSRPSALTAAARGRLSLPLGGPW